MFFSFFSELRFLGLSGVKGQKMAQNDKKFCLLHFISQEPYIIWSLFMVHMCKRIISPGIFFFIFFKILIFLWWWEGVKGAKNDPKWPKVMSHSVSQERYIIWLWFWYTCVKRWYSQQFFSFFEKSDFLGF